MGEILWINGAFGSGKTSVACEINRRLENSYLYDPENVGYFLRNNEPKHMQKNNFQDEILWRKFNVELLCEIAKNHDGLIIAPQTIISPIYYKEIIEELRKREIIVHHVYLDLSEKEIKRRLKKRFEINSWAKRQIPICLETFKDEIFENPIKAENLSITQTADMISQLFGIKLKKADNILLRKILYLKTMLNFYRK